MSTQSAPSNPDLPKNPEREKALEDAVRAIRDSKLIFSERRAGMLDASNIVNAMTERYQRDVAAEKP